MASFKPNVGFGNRFGNYFLGVDQTFAGGDAAMTMAMLYDEATFKGNGTTFNSELQLGSATDSSGAWWKDILTAPAKPGKIKPFIFGTDTMLGLKVAWSGVGGQFPDTVKAGFNRKEFAWAPVTMSEDKKVKMPSFLATIESNIGGGSETAEPSGTGTNGQNRQGGIKSINTLPRVKQQPSGAPERCPGCNAKTVGSALWRESSNWKGPLQGRCCSR